MECYLLHNLSELADRRAVNLRDEAQLWTVLARDLRREAARQDAQPAPRTIPVRPAPQPAPGREELQKRFVGIAEAARMMGIGRSKLYAEIGASRITVRKAGKRSLIAVADIEAVIFRGMRTPFEG